MLFVSLRTDLDIWLICEELNLPVILFTSKTIKGMEEANWLYLSSNDDDFNNKEIHFIRTSSINPSNTPVPYSLITPAFKCDEVRAFKRNLVKEIKVAQFSGYISEHANYHHGENSLHSTTISMCQDLNSMVELNGKCDIMRWEIYFKK